MVARAFAGLEPSAVGAEPIHPRDGAYIEYSKRFARVQVFHQARLYGRDFVRLRADPEHSRPGRVADAFSSLSVFFNVRDAAVPYLGHFEEDGLVPVVDEDASLAIAQRLEIGRLADAFSRSSRRFLFLDLGGTLIPKGDSVSKVLKSATKGALLRPGVRRALQALSEDPQTTVYVVSGTTPSALESLFSDLPQLSLAAANGLATSLPDQRPSTTMTSYGTDWDAVRKAALPLMKRRAAWTNGSAVLKREPGLAWSYYRADPEWGRIQALQLAQDLESILAPFDVAVAHREGMLEIVPQAMHKGHVVKKALSEALSRGEPPDFVLCVGDSLSDEKMFSSVYSYLADAPRAPLDRAFTVAVGRKASRALFYLDDDAHVGDALAALAGRAA